MDKIKVAVLFGGKSTEHEVSIISGIQVLNGLDKDKYDVLPIYITKDGQWILGDNSFYDPKTFKNLDNAIAKKRKILPPSDSSGESQGVILEKPGQMTIFKSLQLDKVDVFFPVFHGRYGEDGCVQGMLEFANVPYVGCGVAAASLGMDKILSKNIASSLGIPVLKSVWVTTSEWKDDKKAVLKSITDSLTFPVFVKPARLGSSIGMTRVSNIKELDSALDVAFFYDSRVMIEQGLKNAREINISLLGNYPPFKFSAAEQPIASSDVLSFEDKYISSSGKTKGMASSKRILPAKIKKQTLDRIKEYASLFFSQIGGKGFARIDFLLSQDETKVYFNEINTMPGSIAFYLWKEVGLSFEKLTNELVELAIKNQEEKSELTYTFSSNILEGFEGTKLSKS